MWSRNALTERLNLKVPILQGPMGLLSTPALAAAVSNAGGLGGLGMGGFSAEDAERRIAGFRQQSSGGLNVNCPLGPGPRAPPAGGGGPPREGMAREVPRETLAMLVPARPEVISFLFGFPQPEVMQAIKSAGI